MTKPLERASSVPIRQLRIGLALVTLAVSLLTGAATAAAADPSSDIPGIPLPGPVAAGRLGGAIYDVVYNLTVEPGHVIVASVTGTAGTDFDLYLFDSTATTVLSTKGLLTKSTGPDSTESISWATQAGGTFYINLNGATDVEGDYRLTVQTVPDPTPPQVTAILAGGATATNQLTLPVTLTASDDLSGVVAMAFSADGVTFGPWQSFQSATTWTFEPGDGVKRLWAKVRNGVGLDSGAASDSIILDTVAPRVLTVHPSPGARVPGLRPVFSVSFDEPLDVRSWLDLGLIVQSASGALVNGSYAYDPSSRTGTFTPATNLVAGSPHIVTVGDVRDVAGNRVASMGSWSVIPLIPTGLTAKPSASVITPGGSSRIDLTLSGAPLPAILEGESTTGDGAVTPLQPISVEDGTNSLGVSPAMNTTYRFVYPGTSTVARAESEARVLVRRLVSLVGRSSSTIARARVGAAVTLTAAISPVSSGVSVSFKLYRFDSARRAWVYAGSKGRTTNSNGRAVLAWTPTAAGSYYWRASVASTAQFANNVSSVYRWSIAR